MATRVSPGRPVAGPAKTPAPEAVQEFNVRMPVRNAKKKYHIMKFNNSLKIDPTKWTQVRMVRENNKKEYKGFEEEMPETGAGSEFGRKQREEARRKKYGINAKKYNPDAQPWLMRIGSKKEGKQYKGIREGGVSENTAFYVFTHAADGAFEAHPVTEWYNFTPRATYKTLNSEEAEERFAERGKILNHFALMVNKKLRPDQDQGDDEDLDGEGGKKGKKGAQAKKDLKISDLDDWIESGDELDSEGDGDKDDDSDDDGPKGKGKGNKKNKDAKKKKKKSKEDVDLEGNEDSDDGDGEGREVDYMSDESSESETEMEEKAKVKGVDADEGLSKMLDSDSSSEDEEKKDDKDKDDDEDETGKKKKKKKKDTADDGDSDDGGKKKKKAGSKNSSRGGSPDRQDPADAEKNQRAEKRKAMVDNILDPSMDPAAKKSRLDTFGAATTSSGNVDASIEEDVRRYLARKQMTTTELLKKFKSKKTGLSKDELMQQLVEALRKINPQKKKSKGVMYLYLKTDQQR